MTGRNSLCLTCLSNTDNGITMPSAIAELLQNVFGFEFTLRGDLPSFVCLQCYRTLCEIKRFYVQLQDVQNYFNEEVVKGIRKRPTFSLLNTKGSLPSLQSGKDGNRRTRTTKIAKPNLYSNIKICMIESLNPLNKEEVAIDLVPEIEDEECTEELSEEMVVANLFTLDVEDIPYKCNECFRVFEVTETYKKHMQWHSRHKPGTARATRVKKFECETCGKRFSTTFERKSHEITHTDLRPYKCNVCSKTFRQFSALSIHRFVHSGGRVECPECGKRFSTKAEMFKHRRVHKKGSRVYRCNICAQTFSNLSEMLEHKLSHNESFKCDVCDKMYCNEDTLQAHVRIAHLQQDDETVIPTETTSEIQKCPVDRSSMEIEDNLFIEAISEGILG